MSTLFATNENYSKSSTYGIYYHNMRIGKKYKDYKSDENVFLVKPTKTYYQSLMDTLNNKTIKNNFKPKQSKPLSEIIVRAIGEDFYSKLDKKEQIKFFQNALEYVQDQVGKDNILSAVIHYDEEKNLPHIHITYLPIITLKEPITKIDKEIKQEITQTKELSGRKLWVKNDNGKDWKKGYKNFQDGIAKFLIEDKQYGKLGLVKAKGVTNQRKKISAEEYKEITNWNTNKEIQKETKKQEEKIIQKENTIKQLSNEVYANKTNLKPFLGKYNVKDVDNIIEKQKEIITKQDLIISEKDALIDTISQAKGFNTKILQEKYEDLTKEHSKLKTSYNKLKKEYEEMTQAFNNIYDIFKTFTKLIIKSPLIQNAKDTLHILIKKFANSSDEELKEIQHKSEEYLQNESEKQYSKKEIYAKQMELEDEEEM